MDDSAISSKFRVPRDTIAWALEAIAEIRSEIERFFSGPVCEVIDAQDRETGYTVKKVRLTRPLPKRILRRTSEALLNTRHAFDQASFAVQNLVGQPLRRDPNFPWAQNPRDLAHLLEARFDERLWTTFQAHHPYPTGDGYPHGDDMIRVLATMANNKHSIGLAVQGHVGGLSFPPIIGGKVQDFEMIAPRWDPELNEAVLARWLGDIKFDGRFTLEFHVLFQDDRLTAQLDLIGGLESFARKATAVTDDLEQRCVEILRAA